MRRYREILFVGCRLPIYRSTQDPSACTMSATSAPDAVPAEHDVAHEQPSNPAPAAGADADMGALDEDAEIEAMKARMAEMEAEAAKLREMTTQADAGAPTASSSAPAVPRPLGAGPTEEEKEEVDARSIYVGNVRWCPRRPALRHA